MNTAHDFPAYAAIVSFHDAHITAFKAGASFEQDSPLWQAIAHNHWNNCRLWLEEDEARRDDLGFEHVYRAKRAIDKYNQQRNNAMEAIDAYFYQHVMKIQNTKAPAHSETPGMMIDRLSILSLKVYHMQQQLERKDVSDAHLQNVQQRLETLRLQRQHLGDCLEHLWQDVTAGLRQFRVYHQFKMYNDPAYGVAKSDCPKAD